MKIGSKTDSSVKGLRCAGAIMVGWSGGEASVGTRIGGSGPAQNGVTRKPPFFFATKRRNS